MVEYFFIYHSSSFIQDQSSLLRITKLDNKTKNCALYNFVSTSVNFRFMLVKTAITYVNFVKHIVNFFSLFLNPFVDFGFLGDAYGNDTAI